MAQEKFIRRPDLVSGDLTEGEKSRMADHIKPWIANALRTDTVDRAELERSIKDLYAVSGLAEPIVVIVPSPRIMAFAGGFASAIWYVREKGIPTEAATEAATRDATEAATRDATEAATRAATGAATRDATRDATRAATRAATWDATEAATGAATRDVSELFAKLAHELCGQAWELGLKCAANWYSVYSGGNMWAGYDSYLTAFRDVLGLKLPAHEAYSAWERCAKSGGFRWVHQKFCMVSDFPERLKIDDQNRPHSADGPSHRWRDGWELWYWHGVAVTEQIVMAPDTLTVAQIEAEANAEVRRVMIERYGHARYIHDSGASVVHELPADYALKGLRRAKLYRKEVPNDEPIIMISVDNSTAEPDGSVKRYELRVQPDAYGGLASKDCLAAMASTWRHEDGSLAFARPQDYVPAVET